MSTYCKIGGIEMKRDVGVSWSYTAGTKHYELNLTVPHATAEAIFKKPLNQVTIEFMDINHSKRTIKNLSCVKKQKVDYFNTEIKIVDARFFLQYLKCFARYNMKRVVNKFEIVPDAPKAARDWWLYPDYTWLYWSVKNATPPSWDNQTPAKGTPYSTLDIADDICKQVFGDFYGGIKSSEKLINAAPDDLDFVGLPLKSVLDRLLNYAAANLGYFPDNKFYIFAKEDNYGWDKKLLKWQKEFRTNVELAELSYPDYSRLIPKTIKVFFRKEKEIIIEAGDGNTLTAFDWDLYPEVRNVTQIPRNMKIDGVFYRRGEYIEISKLINWLGLTEDLVRKRWRDPNPLMILYCNKKGYDPMLFPVQHPIEASLLSRIKADYRTLFQINPEWMSRVLTLKPIRASMVDWTSQTRQPSQVWTNYSGAYLIRVEAEYVKKRGGEWGFTRYDAPYSNTAEKIIKQTDNDFMQNINEADEIVSPFEVQIVNEKLGIIRFTPMRDLHLEVIEFFPGVLKNMPKVAIQKMPRFWSMCNLAEKYRIITVMSAIFATPNNEDQLYCVEVPTVNFGYNNASYPKPWEIISFKVNARENFEGKIIDQDLLTAVAHNEAKLMIRNLKSYLQGTLILAGNFKLELFGYAESITYSFDKGGIKTRLHIPAIPPPLELYSIMKKQERKIFSALEGED